MRENVRPAKSHEAKSGLLAGRARPWIFFASLGQEGHGTLALWVLLDFGILFLLLLLLLLFFFFFAGTVDDITVFITSNNHMSDEVNKILFMAKKGKSLLRLTP